MKISSAVNSVGKAADSGTARPSAPQRAPAPQGGQVEEVAISPLSARLQEISANLAASPAVDAGRVSEIKQAIAEGRFKVNPERIADGLLDSVRQMLARSR